MGFCEEPGCTGHLGKFGSCVDEAAYLASFDAYEWTGDVEWEGHFSLVVVPDLEYGAVVVNEGQPDAHTVQLKVGAYIVRQQSAGFVDADFFESADYARKVFEELGDAFTKWELADEDV